MVHPFSRVQGKHSIERGLKADAEIGPFGFIEDPLMQQMIWSTSSFVRFLRSAF